MTVDKAALLARRLGEDTHEIPGFGPVRFKGLSVAEVREIRALDDEGAQERRMVSAALLEPTLTEDEVRIWQENAPLGEIDGLVLAIAKLSGMTPGAEKSAYKSV